MEGITQLVRQRGLRLTPAKTALLAILSKNGPLSANEVGVKLAAAQQSVNKTTVYRIIKSLIEINVLQEIDGGVGEARFELAGHHHHLVCQQCGQFVCLKESVIEKALVAFERLVARRHQMRVTGHQLCLTGFCQNCAN